MKIKTVADIKSIIRGKVESMKVENTVGRVYGFDAGTKKVKITIRQKTQNNEKSKYGLPVGAVASELVYNNNEVTIVKFGMENNKYHISSYRMLGDEGKFIDEEVKTATSYLIEYWNEYVKFKGNKAFYVYWDNVYQKSDLFSAILNEYGLEPRTDYKSLFNVWLTSCYTLFGKEEKDKQVELDGIISFQKELEESLKNTRAFEIVNTNEHSKKVVRYPFEMQDFYYQNNTFKLLYDNKKVLCLGEGIESCGFLIKQGVVQEILDYLEEQKRLVNLITPPTKYIGELFKVLGVYKQEKDLQDTIIEWDSELGVGEMESECYELDQKIRSKFRNNIEIEGCMRQAYGEIMEVYRVDTQNYIWFIVVSKRNNQVWMYHSDSYNLPKKAKDKMDELIYSPFYVG